MPIEASFRKPALDDDVPTLYESALAQSIEESLSRGLHRDGRIIRQKSDAINFASLLRARIGLPTTVGLVATLPLLDRKSVV